MSKGKRTHTQSLSPPPTIHTVADTTTSFSFSYPSEDFLTTGEVERSIKKVKLSPALHAPICDDPNCTGCEIGEIELDLKIENGESVSLTPIQLYQLAKEEAKKELPEEHGGGVAKRLYDEALQSFEKWFEEGLLENNAMNTDNTKGKGKATEKNYNEDYRYQYALCCISFGDYLPLVEQIQKGVEILEQFVLCETEFAEGLLALGRAYIALARHQRRLVQAELEQWDQGDNDSAGERIPEAELDYYNRGIQAFNKGISIIRSSTINETKKYIAENIHAAQDLTLYADKIDRTKLRDHTIRIYNQALTYIHNAYIVPNFAVNLGNDGSVLGLWGSCLYEVGRLKSAKSKEDAKITLDDAIAKLSKSQAVSDNKEEHIEMLGQAYLLKSTLEDDDSEAETAFDKGVKLLRKAFRKSSDNRELREQLETLGIFEDDQDGIEDSGEENDNEVLELIGPMAAKGFDFIEDEEEEVELRENPELLRAIKSEEFVISDEDTDGR